MIDVGVTGRHVDAGQPEWLLPGEEPSVTSPGLFDRLVAAINKHVTSGGWSDGRGRYTVVRVDDAARAAEEVLRSELTARHELCWLQPDDRLVACDRAKGHKGRHTWEEGHGVGEESHGV